MVLHTHPAHDDPERMTVADYPWEFLADSDQAQMPRIDAYVSFAGELECQGSAEVIALSSTEVIAENGANPRLRDLGLRQL